MKIIGLLGAGVAVLLLAGLIAFFVLFPELFLYLFCGSILFILFIEVAVVGYYTAIERFK